MDFTKASHAFQEYLKDYNQNELPDKSGDL